MTEDEMDTGNPYVPLFRTVRFRTDGRSRYYIEVAACEEIDDPDCAEVCIPHEQDGVLYGVTCYLLDRPHSYPCIAEMLALKEHSAVLLLPARPSD